MKENKGMKQKECASVQCPDQWQKLPKRTGSMMDRCLQELY